MSDLGFCVPCAAAIINPAPLLGSWKTSRLRAWLPILAVAIIVVGLVGWRYVKV